MQISGLNYLYQLWGRDRSSIQDTSASASKPKGADQSQALLAEADAKGTHSIALAREQWRIIQGENIPPENRLSLEGVTAEYLSNMSDEEYRSALLKEDIQYSTDANALRNQAMALTFPSEADSYLGKTQKPEMDADEAKSTLQGYVSTLSDSIKTRNQLQKYLQSDDAWSYLVDRFGEDGAKAERDRTQKEIDVFDGLINNTLTSLNIIYSLDPSSVASEKDGFWSLTTTKGQYTGSAATYNFTIGEDGSIQNG